MTKQRLHRSLAFLVLVLLASTSLQAAMIKKMDLPEVCANAATIVHGTVISVEPGTKDIAGATFPTETVTVAVERGFQGDGFITKGDDQMFVFTTLGEIKPSDNNGIRSFSPLPKMPRLKVGGEYVLMVSAPSAAGLSATVGLGQGCYTVSGQGKEAIVTDELGNSMTYDQLAATIEAAIQQ